MSNQVNDVRPLSHDARYAGVVFSGKIDDAIAQAKSAPDHGLDAVYKPAGMSRDRFRLLQHLNLAPPKPAFSFSLDYGINSGIVR